MKKTLYEMRKEPHYSYSSISSWLQCSLKYFFRYVEKIEPEETSSCLIFGTAIHKTLDMIAGRKMLSQSVSDEEIENFFSIEWNNQLACARKIDFESPDEEKNLREKGIQMIDAYLREWDDEKIIGHAEPFRIEIPGLSKPVLGEYDLIIENGNGGISVVDWKTSGRKWDEGKPHKDGQATLYCLAHRQTTGKMPLFRFDVITKARTTCVQVLETSRTEDDCNRLIKVFQQVERGIQAGVFIPNDTSYFCNSCEFAKNCAEWGRCQNVA